MYDKYPKNRQALQSDDNCFFDSDLFFDVDSVVSGTECTGLMPTPPQNQFEAQSYTDLYAVPTPNTKKNKKGNTK